MIFDLLYFTLDVKIILTTLAVAWVSLIVFYTLKTKIILKIIKPVLFGLFNVSILFFFINQYELALVTGAVILSLLLGLYLVHYDKIMNYQSRSRIVFAKKIGESMWSSDIIKAHIYAEQKNIIFKTIMYISQENIEMQGLKVYAAINFQLLKMFIDGSQYALTIICDNDGFIHYIDYSNNNYSHVYLFKKYGLELMIDKSTKTFSCITESERRDLLSPGQATSLLQRLGIEKE
jgi:hypothetical protein